MKFKQPPKVLVETWVHLLKQNEEPELKKHAQKMLLGAFGDMQKVADYMKMNHIQLK